MFSRRSYDLIRMDKVSFPLNKEAMIAKALDLENRALLLKPQLPDIRQKKLDLQLLEKNRPTSGEDQDKIDAWWDSRDNARKNHEEESDAFYAACNAVARQTVLLALEVEALREEGITFEYDMSRLVSILDEIESTDNSYREEDYLHFDLEQDVKMAKEFTRLQNEFEQNPTVDLYNKCISARNNLRSSIKGSYDQLKEAVKGGSYNSFTESSKTFFKQSFASARQSFLHSARAFSQSEVKHADALLDQMSGFQFIYHYLLFAFIIWMGQRSSPTVQNDAALPAANAQEEQPSESMRLQ